MADTAVGAPGAATGATGVTEFDGPDGGPDPAVLAATTVKEYAVPLVKPSTVHDVVAVVVQVWPPGADVTVYPVIGDPPFEAGAVKLTVA